MSPIGYPTTKGVAVSPLELSIINHIRDSGPLSRSELTQRIGLSRSSINKAVAQLNRHDLLLEADYAVSSGGRPPGLLDINAGFGCVLALDMGATGANICLADFRGTVIGSARYPIQLRNNSPARVMDDVLTGARHLLDSCGLDAGRVYGIGVGVPAPVDPARGRIISPATMIGWEEFSIPDYLRGHFPNAIISLDNDVNLMAQGEARIGAGAGHANFFFVKIGTGVGCGIIIDGAVYRGSWGVSGHIGHVSIDRDGPVCHCGNSGCLERYVSGPALAMQGEEAARNGTSPMLADLMSARGGSLLPEDVGAAAARGDRVANTIITDSGRTIGRVLATLVSFFNPSLVVIGGSVSEIGPQFHVAIHRAILEYSLPLSTQHITITRSTLGHRAGMAGAIHSALQQIFIAE